MKPHTSPSVDTPSVYIPLPTRASIQRAAPEEYIDIPAYTQKLKWILQQIYSKNPKLPRITFSAVERDDYSIAHTRERHIFVPSGMLELAKNDMQIAFVLCHEIAHWAQGDYTRRGARIPRGVHDIASSELVADIKWMELYVRTGYPKHEVMNLIWNIRNASIYIPWSPADMIMERRTRVLGHISEK